MQDDNDQYGHGDDESDEIIDDGGAERELPQTARQVMRFTVIDPGGTVSFIAPYNALKALVAGLSRTPEPTNLAALLDNANRYDDTLKNFVLDGLALFDEHNVSRPQGPGSSAFANLSAVPNAPTPLDDLMNPDVSALPNFDDARVLRVIDAASRDSSLKAVGVGLVIINLPAHRVIQVQNTYGFLKREDRGRFFVDGQPTSKLYYYKLPQTWSMLP